MSSKRKTPVKSIRDLAIANGFRSGLEDAIADKLTSQGVGFSYEELVLAYVKPVSTHKYTPDFVLLSNGIVVESKGRFLLEDRKKHLLIKAQHPDVDLRFVFSNSKTRMSKRSPTTYGMWATKHGFLYADKLIPQEWINESPK